MNSRLGTIMLWLSELMIVVARMLMRSTFPVVARDRHDVADADRPLQEQDDAANEVGDDLLQPEPQPDAQGRQDHADLGQVEVNRRRARSGSPGPGRHSGKA